ncbi:unnamed protein product [Bursaphelenchus okinawaensis]|uniref:Uncharacterized protein n=1 Tax=Bursaphelenchus okinawaensis TaxID=465554 RepID=A0A811JVU5_9BILA|nr:unnamed protein product [Bursaphelenchus okinawaensis]CAG9085627.1 unnamed protein product [Bursaphelenchus okinawaensis]
MSADGAVRKLRTDVARQISTGQVVVSLMGACRELVDNALDAGATTIEVKLREHGADLLEVSDNGHGIAAENFESLGKAHATSKLTDFNDFNSLLTFGFRGEALNALCALGTVTVITRHKSAKLATKLTFSPQGEITSQTTATRPVGSTVSVEKLFNSLPVRRKEFVRNAKREMHRLLGSVQAFALSRTDVRFTVANGGSGRLIQILNSPGNNANLMQVMTSLFGASVSKKSLVPIKTAEPDEKCLDVYELRYSDTVMEECKQIGLSGYISNCEAGNGRHTTDRQFIFINKRPIDHPKLCKIANEMYSVFNKGSFCILVLFIEVDPAQLDVNVTPDKRIVYLRNEKELFAKFRASILATFEGIAGKNTVARELLPTQSQFFTTKDLSENDSRNDDYDLYGTPPATSPNREPFREKATKGPSAPKRPCTMDSFVDRISSTDTTTPRLTETVTLQSHMATDDFMERSFLANSTALDEAIDLHNAQEFQGHIVHATTQNVGNHVQDEEQMNLDDLDENQRIMMSNFNNIDSRLNEIAAAANTRSVPILTMANQGDDSSKNTDKMKNSYEKIDETMDYEPKSRPVDKFVTKLSANDGNFQKVSDICGTLSESQVNLIESFEGRVAKDGTMNSEASENDLTAESVGITDISTDYDVNIEEFRPLWREIEEADIGSDIFSYNYKEGGTQKHEEEDGDVKEGGGCCTSTQVGLEVMNNLDFEENSEKAEEKLALMLKAENFDQMSVIGQYNNAFILARHGHEMFMIDQHAADEKYNFEWLQKNAKVRSQGVYEQSQMAFGPVDEAILMSNLEILSASGFEFEVDPEDQPGSRIRLTSVPTLCGWHFDKADIEECISALKTFPSAMYRPVKLRKIFASKACRKSVMFGDKLSMEQMVTIVRHMGTMEQPWNCPHGRPTIRHVCTLKDAVDLPLADDNIEIEREEQEEGGMESQETNLTFDVTEAELDKENLNETQYEEEQDDEQEGDDGEEEQLNERGEEEDEEE